MKYPDLEISWKVCTKFRSIGRSSKMCSIPFLGWMQFIFTNSHSLLYAKTMEVVEFSSRFSSSCFYIKLRFQAEFQARVFISNLAKLQACVFISNWPTIFLAASHTLTRSLSKALENSSFEEKTEKEKETETETKTATKTNVHWQQVKRNPTKWFLATGIILSTLKPWRSTFRFVFRIWSGSKYRTECF